MLNQVERHWPCIMHCGYLYYKQSVVVASEPGVSSTCAFSFNSLRSSFNSSMTLAARPIVPTFPLSPHAACLHQCKE
jgi:hypothetical protein